MQDLKTLPNGEWIHFANLPPHTTGESFAVWLRQLGLEVDSRHISVKEYCNCCTAVLSLPHEEISVLLNWLINGAQFEGCTVSAAPHQRNTRKG